MKALLHVLRTAGPLTRLAPAALLAATAELVGVALMTTAAWLIARAAEHPAMGTLSIAIVGVRALAVTRGLFRYGERLAGHHAALAAVATLRRRVFGALARQSPRQDARTVRDADAVSRLVADVDLVQDALLRVAVPALSALLASAAALLCATLLAPSAALVLAGGLAAGGLLVPALTALASTRGAHRSAALRAELAVRGGDLLDGAADLQAFGAVRTETAAAEDTARRLRAHDRGAALLAAVAAAALTVVQGVCTLAVALVCAHAVADGRLAAVWAVALPLLALASFEALAPLPAAAQLLGGIVQGARRLQALTPGRAGRSGRSGRAGRESLASGRGFHEGARETARGSADRLVGSDHVVRDVAPHPAARIAGRDPAPLPAAPGQSPRPGAAYSSPAVAAHLSVRQLHVRYRESGPAALCGVDLELPPGRRTAVIGASGSGKSTLLAAIARLVEPERGEILLGGDPLPTVPEAQLRRAVGGALQDAHVFHTTLRNNLLPARPGADDGALEEALRQAGLLDWVRSLPRGLDTSAGPDGGSLSGGQRQRLVLARALLARPPLLLLDEPTEALDPATADAVLADVLRATEGRSLLLVTHRTAGLHALDEVVVMDAGRIVRRGAPAAVLEPYSTDPGQPLLVTG
ncbi:ATP-binding cassette domain-containing protein [Streptomyces sp. NPDC050738]|uniref:amino acid ABC transporter ATP-binding/permease protein n=1 Tax=Streptomyces sp. NPDC050738 TaxID=3154744 RepID=UPI00343C9D39